MTEQLVVSASTESLRTKVRCYVAQEREKRRENDTDALRLGLGEIKLKIAELQQLTMDDVKGLVMRIKRRKSANFDDMYRLSHAFLQTIENINTFANTPGALQVLIKELTGNNGKRQVYALECLCNLSLGEAAVCLKISNMAGSYLAVTCLDISEEQHKRLALWTIANILATSGKGAASLMKLELLPKLWHLYIADAGGNDQDYRVDAGICLQQIALKASTLLSLQDCQFLRENLMSKNPTCPGGEFLLQIFFHSRILTIKANLTETELLFVLNTALGHLTRNQQLNDISSRLQVFYAVRILANIICVYLQSFRLLLQQLYNVWHTNLLQILNKLFSFSDDALTKETLWLLKNLLLQPNQCAETNQFDFLSRLQVYDCGSLAITENKDK